MPSPVFAARRLLDHLAAALQRPRAAVRAGPVGAAVAPDAEAGHPGHGAEAQQGGAKIAVAAAGVLEPVRQRNRLACQERRDQPVAGRDDPGLDPGRDLAVAQVGQDGGRQHPRRAPVIDRVIAGAERDPRLAAFGVEEEEDAVVAVRPADAPGVEQRLAIAFDLHPRAALRGQGPER
jgi:hypothetical protein